MPPGVTVGAPLGIGVGRLDEPGANVAVDCGTNGPTVMVASTIPCPPFAVPHPNRTATETSNVESQR
jgi:hypothetical protein